MVTFVVHRQAATARTIKEGRRIDAKHVRRKQLSTYLPSSVLQRNKRQVSSANLSQNGSTPTTPASGTFAQPRKRPSDVALDAVMMKKVRTRESTDGTRNLEVRLPSVRDRITVCRCRPPPSDSVETQTAAETNKQTNKKEIERTSW